MEPEAGGGQGELELRNYLRVLWRRKIIIAASIVLCALFAYQSASSDPKTYRASTEVLLQPSASEEVFAPDELSEGSSGRAEIQTAIEVMTSGSVQSAVAEELGYAPRISITQQGETDVVAISASARSGQQAANDAQTYAETYVELSRSRLIEDLLDGAAQVQAALDAVRAEIAAIEAPLTELDNDVLEAADFETRQAAQIRADAARASAAAQLGALRSREASYTTQLDALQLATKINTTGGAQIVTPAEAPPTPSSPRPRRDAAAGAALGLVLGVVLAFVREHFYDRIRDESDVAREAAGLPVLATVPAAAMWRRSRQPALATKPMPSSLAAESYRRLRTAIQFLDGGSTSKIILVTSASSTESTRKSSVAANLASALARVGSRVVAVDCDLHRSRLHQHFGLSNDIGLTSVLTGEASLGEAVQQVSGPSSLTLLTAGPHHPDPSDLLAGKKLREILNQLAAEADFVIVESAPTLAVTDPLVLSAAVNSVVLVVRSGRTRAGSLTRARDRLDQVDAPVVGAVLVDVPIKLQRFTLGPQVRQQRTMSELRSRIHRAPTASEGNGRGTPEEPTGAGLDDQASTPHAAP